MSRAFFGKDKCVVLESDTREMDEFAKALGLIKSTLTFGPHGENRWYSGNYDKDPVENPYAAVALADIADAELLAAIAPYLSDYEKSLLTTSESSYPAPDGMVYRPYQIAGIDYALSKKNVLIGDEPGLGKTIQAIGIANAEEMEKILVIAPAAVRLNWHREIRTWSTIPGVVAQCIFSGKELIHPEANYVIASYNIIQNENIRKQIERKRWDMLICDEMHYTKTPEAKRTRALFGGGRSDPALSISGYANRVIGLTGTPLPNRPRECYTIARALCWDAIDFGSFDDFAYRYNPKKGLGNYHAVGRLPELRARMRCNFVVRRLKKNVLTDLPEKQYEMSYIETNGNIKRVLAKEKLIDFDVNELVNPNAELFGQISTIRREMGEAKVPRIVEHMKYLLDIVRLEKIVLFCHHKSVMDEIRNALDKYGIVEFRGGISPKIKQHNINRFMTDPKIRIFSGQIDAAGHGIDGLQKVCSNVVFGEPAWVPGSNEQAVDRCHRIGQNNAVVAQFLIVEGSFDERVLATIFEKAHVIHKVLDQ